jgi:hypothetical protein
MLERKLSRSVRIWDSDGSFQIMRVGHREALVKLLACFCAYPQNAVLATDTLQPFSVSVDNYRSTRFFLSCELFSRSILNVNARA